MRAKIVGTGSCLPPKVVTNDDLSKILDTSDEWISTRTGIKQRHCVDPSANETEFFSRYSSREECARHG